MGVYEWLFLLAAAVLFVVPPIFIWHRVYDDGVFGRLGLSAISFFAFVILAETIGSRIPHWLGKEDAPPALTYETSGEVAGLVVGFAVFLCWHLTRFHLRVVLKRPRPEPSSGKRTLEQR